MGVFEDFAANSTLIIISACLIIVSCTSNATGVGITKYGSAAQRTTVGLAKNFNVWIVFMVIPITYWNPVTQAWESKTFESFAWLQLIGFIVLVFGVLVFNEILVLPWFGFDKNTKIQLAIRKAEEE